MVQCRRAKLGYGMYNVVDSCFGHCDFDLRPSDPGVLAQKMGRCLALWAGLSSIQSLALLLVAAAMRASEAMVLLASLRLRISRGATCCADS